jgi:hypothetical protein
MFLGGGVVTIANQFLSRETALRLPYLLGAIFGTILFIIAAPKLTTGAIERARAEANK